VVGGPGRALKARPGFYRAQPAGTRTSVRPPGCGGGLKSAFLRARGFTLLELLLVLALLAMAVAIAAPSLSRFFHGRALDSEGRRMVSMTRYAQSRAVSEGVPMVMWFNPDQGTYGVEAEMTYTDTDTKAVEYQLDSNLEMELPSTVLNDVVPWKITKEIGGMHPAIRFTPDGFISETSPEWVWLKVARDDHPDAVWLALSANRLNYELQSLKPDFSR